MRSAPLTILLIPLLVITLSACSEIHIGDTDAAPALEYLNNPGRTDTNPYSNMVVHGDTVYLAGAIGRDPETGEVPEDVEEEIRIVLDSMKGRLERVGMSMNDLVTVQVFCPDLTLYDTFNNIYRTYFDGHFPARAFIGSGPLLSDGRFEVLGTAIRQ
ncbi:MAG: Rid family hydrolase [Acidobacteriota bacterium]|nr:Rid family hydrolase [Acidobacteriota bacterium]